MATEMKFIIKTDNTDLIKEATREAILVALEAVGLQAEGYAKRLCPFDTGLLRNSITHTVGGSSYTHNYTATRSKTKSGAKRSGSASGTLGTEDDMSAYIGTNVEYAAYVEFGTSKTAAQPFLKPAVMNHTEQYKRIFETYLKNA